MASTAAAPTQFEAGAPGSMGDVRRGNLALVLGCIANSKPGTHLTRAQIAAATGLTKASVSSLVLDLLDSAVLKEIGLNPQAERGRPGVGLGLNPARGVMGMEINVDYISAGLTDLAGNLLIRKTREQDNRDASPVFVQQALACLAAEVRAMAEAQGVSVLGGGLAVPGLVDDKIGMVITAPNLGWNTVKLDLNVLLPNVPLGTTLFNEANAAALAELRNRPAGYTDFLFVSGEVGVGSGLVIGSELFTGPHGHAGELGHVIVQPGGAPCSCGGTGCLETLAGQDAIFAAAGVSSVAFSKHRDAPRTQGGEGVYRSRSVRLAQLKSALLDGDAKALAAVATAGNSLGIALASTIRILNISSVVLSGHFAVLADWLRPALLGTLEEYAPGVVEPESVVFSNMGESGAILGAAESVVRSIVDSPHRLADLNK
ncbi:ROK family protein [Pseudarthrobacter sp. NPDC058329]|uniref:ROK family protein n=1 Tax=Pseudarthrobacter sp. NPDC058329 TaxID=3346448 RepID=UPI0036D7E22F